MNRKTTGTGRGKTWPPPDTATNRGRRNRKVTITLTVKQKAYAARIIRDYIRRHNIFLPASDRIFYLTLAGRFDIDPAELMEGRGPWTRKRTRPRRGMILEK